MDDLESYPLQIDPAAVLQPSWLAVLNVLAHERFIHRSWMAFYRKSFHSFHALYKQIGTACTFILTHLYNDGVARYSGVKWEQNVAYRFASCRN